MLGAPSMSKTDRVLAALRGDPVDRPPISFWFHMGTEEDPPEVVAEAEIELLQLFDLDWLKVMHDYAFGDPATIRSIRSPRDFCRIRPVRPDEGGFASQTEVLRRIADAVGNEAFFIDTVFSPWSIAEMCCGWRLLELVREDADAVREGLRIIADSMAAYIPAARMAGASGVYYVIDGAQANTAEYCDTVGALDLQLLEHARGAPFNVLHVHGEGISLAPFTGYPVSALSFSIGPTQPTTADVRDSYAGALMTGIDEIRTLRTASSDQIRDEVHRSLRAAEPRGLLLAPGCAIPRGVSAESLWAAREAAYSYAGASARRPAASPPTTRTIPRTGPRGRRPRDAR